MNILAFLSLINRSLLLRLQLIPRRQRGELELAAGVIKQESGDF